MTLDGFFAAHPKVALAFSGGCDSSYLLAESLRRGIDVKAYLVDTAFQPRFEIADAFRVVDELGAKLEVLTPNVLAQSEVCTNDPQRCYYCKRFIFSNILQAMDRDGYEVLMDGTNASDDPANRPGFKALHELRVESPLRAAGMTKDAIRNASRELGLSTADKPNFSCLATKVPHDTTITVERLQIIETEVQKSWSNTK